MSGECDVIVIGGGPAGAAAAIACQQRDIRTVLLERRGIDVRAEHAPGETLQPAMETLFRALGVQSAIAPSIAFRHSGHLIQSTSGLRYSRFGGEGRNESKGFLLDRRRFDALLLRYAADSGVTVIYGASALSVVREGGRLTQIETTAGRFGCRFVVDASGGRQWLRHQLNLTCKRISPTLIARFGWAGTRAEAVTDPLPVFSFDDCGWRWTAPTGSNTVAWVELDLRGGQLSGSQGLAENHSKHRMRDFQARDVSWRLVPDAAGPGYFLVGDAAWILDPACSHGVQKAIMSGMVAAEAILNSRDDDSEIRQQTGYCAWMTDWFCRDARALAELYSQMSAPPTWLSSASEAARKIAMSPQFQSFASSSSEN